MEKQLQMQVEIGGRGMYHYFEFVLSNFCCCCVFRVSYGAFIWDCRQMLQTQILGSISELVNL